MLRRFHSLPGLVFAVLLTVIAVTGVILAVEPTMDRIAYPALTQGMDVATLADAVAARHESVDAIKVREDGAVTATYSDGDGNGVEVVDPATGAGLGPYQTSAFSRFMINLHRSFLAGDAGRVAAAVGALGMLVLTVSGTALLVRRLGGIGALLRPMRGTPAQRWHGELGRLAAIGLVLSSLTGLWMSASTFGLVPTDDTEVATVAASGFPAAPIRGLKGLAAVPLTDLKELTFPAAGDPADSFVLTVSDGVARVDPSTGAVLAFQPATMLDRVGEVIRMLHTGRGLWALGLILGLSAAAVPALGATGVVLWWRRRAALPRVAENVAARAADTVILVGSEGNSTWGFAATLHAALTEAGHCVHLAAMNDLSAAHLAADRLIVLTATYGDGAAPASAKSFLNRLARLEGRVPVAVLGFGDRTFPHFCAYAHDVSDALEAAGWPRLVGLKRIDRRSAQEFAQWGADLGAVLGHDLVLNHVAERPRTEALELIEREDYGEAVGAPVAILRFQAPADPRTGRAGKLPTFEAGDLVGILPPGSDMPRFYSLASSTADGVLEICVRLRHGGLCSTYLHSLAPGETADVFIRENPTFRPVAGRSPLILIGAGAGIGPLAGFVRANAAGRPVHLYWGGRSPSSDFLYEHELAQYLAEKRLTTLRTAFSRAPDDGSYVQDRIAADAVQLRELIRHGAQILVCGGRDMAHSVTHTLEAVIRPLGIDLATLKARGRYVEDVY